MKRMHLAIVVFALFFDHVAFSQRLLKGIDIGGSRVSLQPIPPVT